MHNAAGTGGDSSRADAERMTDQSELAVQIAHTIAESGRQRGLDDDGMRKWVSLILRMALIDYDTGGKRFPPPPPTEREIAYKRAAMERQAAKRRRNESGGQGEER